LDVGLGAAISLYEETRLRVERCEVLGERRRSVFLCWMNIAYRHGVDTSYEHGPARSLAFYGVGRDRYIVTLKSWRQIGRLPSMELFGRALG
jgi:hypothetical protein